MAAFMFFTILSKSYNSFFHDFFIPNGEISLYFQLPNFLCNKKMYFCSQVVMKFFTLRFILFFLIGCYLLAQPQSPEKRAEAFFKNGFSEFQSENYKEALVEFNKVFSLYETVYHDPANFYSGLCYFHLKDYDQAIKKFQKNIDKPQSKYKEEAEYHKGLAMLQMMEKREGGLYVLMELEEKTSNQSLKEDIRNAIGNFLFSSRLYFLKKYYEKVRTSYKSVLAEAIAYQYYLEKEQDSLENFIKNYEKNYPLTTNLTKFKNSKNSHSMIKSNSLDTLKVALVLPLNLNEYSDSSQSIKLLNRYALEFLYGFEFGIQIKEFPNIQKIVLKVFDSQKDSNQIKQIIQKEFVHFSPDIIIGEFLTSNSQILSQYCESKEILQIIPFANSDNLTINKNYTFLQNATLMNQTAVIAKWICNQSEFKNIVGIFDDNPEGKKSSQIFQKELEKSHKNVNIEYFEQGNWQNSVHRIVKVCLDTLRLVDAVFMNIQKQEHFELLLNKLTRSDTTQFTLMTVNDIRNFNRIDGKKWFYFSTIFTQFFDNQNRINEKEKFQNEIYTKYKIQPNQNLYQGMDISEILFYALIERKKGLSWKESFQNIKAFQGFNQNYYFGQSNSNQSIKLYQFQKNGVNQIETW